jgi:hypothetical protein
MGGICNKSHVTHDPAGNIDVEQKKHQKMEASANKNEAEQGKEIQTVQRVGLSENDEPSSLTKISGTKLRTKAKTAGQISGSALSTIKST